MSTSEVQGCLRSQDHVQGCTHPCYRTPRNVARRVPWARPPPTPLVWESNSLLRGCLPVAEAGCHGYLNLGVSNDVEDVQVPLGSSCWEDLKAYFWKHLLGGSFLLSSRSATVTLIPMAATCPQHFLGLSADKDLHKAMMVSSPEWQDLGTQSKEG